MRLFARLSLKDYFRSEDACLVESAEGIRSEGNVQDLCDTCGKQDWPEEEVVLKRRGRCFVASYCPLDCQRVAWVDQGHKLVCVDATPKPIEEIALEGDADEVMAQTGPFFDETM
jgi:hypothetical protein